ncbi:MAG: enoyl-CoA hydratase/isomerase family protein [Flavobacterium sp.]
MNYQNILLERCDDITIITINRPDKLNALNRATIEELHHAFTAENLDPISKAIILSGSGTKAFVAGADISEFAHFSVDEGAALSAEGQKKLFNYIENLQTPVIAAINGFALGGGLELAMACHIRIASENAKMGLPEVTLGVIPGYGGTQRLPQLVGKGRAMEMIMTAQMLDAASALQFGLVNHVVPQTELLEFAKQLAAKITKNSVVAVAKAIEAINANYKDSVDGYQTEIKNFGECFGTHDFKEGTTAFLEKRKPIFPGK